MTESVARRRAGQEDARSIPTSTARKYGSYSASIKGSAYTRVLTFP
jgi:hypothetical protein